jgi:hypothetical protein
MSDKLAELFADRNLSYTGAGLSYAGDASGNAVTQPEQTLQIRRNVADSDDAAASTSTHPFLCPTTTDGSTASVVVAGDVNGVTATNLSLTISNSGTKVVYVNVTYTADVTAHGYVVGFSGAITCALATGSSVPSDTSTHLYRHIATYVDGTRTVQAVTTSLEVVVRDNGSGTSTATAIWGIA